MVNLRLCRLWGTIAMMGGGLALFYEIFIEPQPSVGKTSLLTFVIGGFMVITFYYYKKKIDGLRKGGLKNV